MFYGCEFFNQPLNDWNLSKVKNMNSMFANCTSFNQPLNNWKIDKIHPSQINTIFKNCNISEENKPTFKVINCPDKEQQTIINNEFKIFENNPITIVNTLNFINDKCLYNQNNPYLIHYETFEGFSYPVITILKGTLLYTARKYKNDNQLESYFNLYKLANNNNLNQYKSNHYENALTYFFPVPYMSFVVDSDYKRIDMVSLTKDVKLLALITPSPLSRSVRNYQDIYENINENSFINCPSRNYDLCIRQNVIDGLKLNGYIGIANADSLSSNLEEILEEIYKATQSDLSTIKETAVYKSSCINNLINTTNPYPFDITCRTIGIPEIVLIPYDVHNYPQDYENVQTSFMSHQNMDSIDNSKFVFKYVEHIEGNLSSEIGDKMMDLLVNYGNTNKIVKSLQCPQLLYALSEEIDQKDYVKPFAEDLTYKDVSFTDAYKNEGKCAFETPLYYMLRKDQIGGKIDMGINIKSHYVLNNKQQNTKPIMMNTYKNKNNKKTLRENSNSDFYYNEVNGIPILIMTKNKNNKKTGGKKYTKKILKRKTKKILKGKTKIIKRKYTKKIVKRNTIKSKKLL
jgi:hypothetical protein